MHKPPARASAALLPKSSLASTRVSSIRSTAVCTQCYSTIPAIPRSIADRNSYRSYLYHSPRRRHQSAWAAAVNTANTIFNHGKPPPADPPLPGGVKIDPFKTVAKEMKFLTKNMRQLLGSGHPVLDTVAKYYTQAEGKHIRPMLVLLMSQATSKTTSSSDSTSQSVFTSDNNDARLSDQSAIDTPLTNPSVLSDLNPDFPSPLRSDNTSTYSLSESSNEYTDILPSQRRLAEITELIHTASLLHDDVLDTSTTRRGASSANIAFGNKMAVLAGDFLLGRASVALARLRNPAVTELLATVIANLIEGEFMQLRNTAEDETNPVYRGQETLEWYLQKTYLKSASLISKSCRAAAILGGAAEDVVEAAYSYGRNLGLAFQLVDDMLDFTAGGGSGGSLGAEQLGKPAGADLELGLATAPLLFAWKQNPELGELVGRKFERAGDVQLAKDLVARSDGIEQTRALAQEYADKAIEAVRPWPESEAKGALVEMCDKVMSRKK